MAIDWSGLLNAGVNLYAASRNSSQNQNTANQYAQQARYNPYNVSAGNSGVLFNGNNASASLSPAYQQLQSQLTGNASGLLGGLGAAYANGGINPFLQSSFDTYNQQGADPSSLSNFANPQQALSTNIGDQFNATSQGFLGGLGSFNPTQAASDYTNNLRQQASTGNFNQAQDLAQGLFNTGRLGSTGGSNVYGQLVQAQNQQDLGFQQAGRDYAGQEQNRIAGLASGFGQAGTGINQNYAQANDQFTNNAFNRASSINQLTNQRATQRFTNAMNLFGAGQTGLQNQLSGSLGMLQGSQGLDQNLLQTIMTGGYLGGASSSANANAYNPSLQAGQAGNNAVNTGLVGLLDSSGALNSAGNWLNGLFGRQGGSSNLSGLTGGVQPTTGANSGNTGVPSDFTSPTGNSQWWGVSDPRLTGSGDFNGAGGQAAGDTSGNGFLNSMFGGGNYNFLGGAASNIPNGLQDLSNVFGNATQGLSNSQLAGYLGSGSAMDAISKAGVGGTFGSYAGAAGQALGYVGAAKQALNGNIPGAAISALGTYLPAAGLFFAAGDLANHAFSGGASDQRNMAAYKQASGATNITIPQGHVTLNYSSIPDGNGGYKLVSNSDYKELAGNWYGATQAPDGNQSDWKQKYQTSLKNLKSAEPPKGYTFDSSTGKIMYKGKVAGNYG